MYCAVQCIHFEPRRFEPIRESSSRVGMLRYQSEQQSDSREQNFAGGGVKQKQKIDRRAFLEALTQLNSRSVPRRREETRREERRRPPRSLLRCAKRIGHSVLYTVV